MINDSYSVILLYAGKSERFTNDKILAKIYKQPLFTYSFNYFQAQKNCNQIILVCSLNNISEIKKYLSNNNNKSVKLIIGGENRAASVRNGLLQVKNLKVIIHDGARPLINTKDLHKLLTELNNYDAVSLACKITNTIKLITKKKVTTLNRNNLIEVITPQGFKTKIIQNAYSKIHEHDLIKYFDDLMIIEKNLPEAQTKIIFTNNKYLKITTPDDLQIAKMIVKEENHE